MTDMREAVARAICQSTEADVFDELPEGSIYRAVYMQQADAALSLMQPEIDRREAAAKAVTDRLRDLPDDVAQAAMDKANAVGEFTQPDTIEAGDHLKDNSQ